MRSSNRQQRLTSVQVAPARRVPDLVEDVRHGLLERPRALPPKYFYDDRGSQLFEDICATPEYYPSRAEAALLAEHADEIVDSARPAHLLELGSGSSRKTRHLLDACDRQAVHCAYWPFDVSAQMMLDAGAELVADYPWLAVHALIGDYTGGLAHLPLPDDGRRLIAFLGGTIGNFDTEAAQRILGEIAALMRAGDRLLLGFDRVKPAARLEAAYDDAAGVTAEFNRNMLRVLNRELDADFDVAAFDHRAVFDDTRARIEMRLVARRDQRVTLGALDTYIDIAAGEPILTEISRKFTPESMAALLATAGLRIVRHFEAGEGDYSLALVARDD